MNGYAKNSRKKTIKQNKCNMISKTLSAEYISHKIYFCQYTLFKSKVS